MKGFIESGYRFEFSDDWEVIKYDDHRFYKVLSGHDMSGVDFAGVYNDESIYLIEIKNFNQYTDKQNHKPIDEFVNEIVEKGKDSMQLIGVIKKHLERKFWYKAFYGLVGRFSWLNPEWYLWTEFYRLSSIENKAKFVLLVDADYDLKEISDKLKEHLLPYYQKVIVLSIPEAKTIEGLNISVV